MTQTYERQMAIQVRRPDPQADFCCDECGKKISENDEYLSVIDAGVDPDELPDSWLACSRPCAEILLKNHR